MLSKEGERIRQSHDSAVVRRGPEEFPVENLRLVESNGKPFARYKKGDKEVEVDLRNEADGFSFYSNEIGETGLCVRSRIFTN